MPDHPMFDPAPGSKAAKDEGCTCPRIDNHYGEGRPDGSYIITASCPLHGEAADDDDAEGA